MMKTIAIIGLLFAAGMTPSAWGPVSTGRVLPARAKSARSTPPAAMLPDRLLRCTLSRITNFDPSKEQLPTQLAYEGRHVVTLFLPAIPVRTSEPPRSTLPPEPVDRRTRIVADPDRIAAGAAKLRFDRVVDYWPEKVEMTTPVGGGEVHLIMLQPTENAPGSTDIFMTKARDAVTYDKDRMYAGRCDVKLGAAARSAAG